MHFVKLVRRVPLRLLFLCVALMSAATLAPAQAATLTVTTLANSNTGSLRNAINNAASGDTIKFKDGLFKDGVTSTIKLSKELSISKTLTIQGPGARKLMVSGDGVCRVFHVQKTSAGITVNISGLTIANGKANGGAGLDSNGTVTLRDCTFSGNVALQGGGIYNATATLTAINCTFVGNQALAGTPTDPSQVPGLGGGIHNEDGIVKLSNCTFSGNSARFGGGIHNSEYGVDGIVTLTNCTLANNSATDAGGGLYNSYIASIKNSILFGNSPSDVYTGTNTGAATTSEGYNIIYAASGTPIPLTTGDQPGANPLLGEVDTSGPTDTYKLSAGSPAIDKGSGTGYDQRGMARPQDDINIPNAFNGNGSDIGAYEVAVATPAPTPEPCEGWHLNGEVINCAPVSSSKTAWTIKYTLTNCTGATQGVTVEGNTNKWADAISSAKTSNPSVQVTKGSFVVKTPDSAYTTRKILWTVTVNDGEEPTLTLTIVGPAGTTGKDLTNGWKVYIGGTSGTQVATALPVPVGCPN
jgi:hypothetical protein